MIRKNSRVSRVGAAQRLGLACKVAMEGLEKRLCLSAVTWIGTTGNWNNPANWNDSGLVPGSGDDVTIPSGANVTVSDHESAASITAASGSTFSISGAGSLVLVGTNTTSFSGTLDISGNGTLDIGPATNTLNGTTNWSGGTINLQGNTLTNSSSGTMNLSGSLVVDGHEPVFGVLDNQGTIVQSGGTINFGEVSGLNNQGSYQFTGDGSIDATAFNGTFNSLIVNSGTITKTGGVGTSTIELDVNNSGTIQAESGTISLTSNTLTQVTSNTLTAGTWAAINGATLSFPSGTNITSNQASLTLSGAGANITEIFTLANNSGDLTVESGAILTTGGDFTNSGMLTIGTASNVSVIGTFTQTSAGTLSDDLGGTSGGQYGTLSSSGAQSLGGTLATVAVNSYTPSDGDQFTIITYPSATGTFADFTTQPGTAPVFTPTVNSTNVTISAGPRQTALSDSLTGPTAFGTQAFIPANTALPYAINFSNGAAATAAAQTATITTQLDSNLNFSTFQFGTITFGGNTVDVPANQQSFSTQVSETGPGILVNVNASFDATTGVATWTFSTLDPNTSMPPTNQLLGFLTTGQSGSVTYTAQANSSATTGTTIGAQASAAFNGGSATDTNSISDTLDADIPTGTITPLPATDTPTFTVSWSGQESASGPGIATYSVFVSDNGGTFAPFQTNTSQTSAAFSGVAGDTYGFYVVATDNAGSVGVTPTTAQASTLASTGTFKLGVLGTLKIKGTGGNDTIKAVVSGDNVVAKSDGTSQPFALSAINSLKIVGGQGDDTIKVGAGVPVAIINGSAGDNDTITAKNDAADTVLGGTGANSITGGGTQAESLLGGSGNDTMVAGHGNDTLSGGAGDDSLVGGSGADLLLGGTGADTLSAASGSSTLKGNGGADSLLGNGTGALLIGGGGSNTIVP